MTRDEYREKCLKAMKAGFFSEYNQPNPPPGVDICLRAAFDFLHGIARVVPVEATEEMIAAGLDVDDRWCCEGDPTTRYKDEAEVFCAMSTTGDLTNPQEK